MHRNISKNKNSFTIILGFFLFTFVMMFVLSTINAFVLLIFSHSLFYLLVNIRGNFFFLHELAKDDGLTSRVDAPQQSIFLFFSINIKKLCNCLFCRKRKRNMNDSEHFPRTYPICIISSETKYKH